jgi:hypothetical protein
VDYDTFSYALPLCTIAPCGISLEGRMAAISSCPNDGVWRKFHLNQLPDAEARGLTPENARIWVEDLLDGLSRGKY